MLERSVVAMYGAGRWQQRSGWQQDRRAGRKEPDRMRGLLKLMSTQRLDTFRRFVWERC
jgi:hypothetical protein